jgi:hypothetical protein
LHAFGCAQGRLENPPDLGPQRGEGRGDLIEQALRAGARLGALECRAECVWLVVDPAEDDFRTP